MTLPCLHPADPPACQSARAHPGSGELHQRQRLQVGQALSLRAVGQGRARLASLHSSCNLLPGGARHGCRDACPHSQPSVPTAPGPGSTPQAAGRAAHAGGDHCGERQHRRRGAPHPVRRAGGRGQRCARAAGGCCHPHRWGGEGWGLRCGGWEQPASAACQKPGAVTSAVCPAAPLATPFLDPPNGVPAPQVRPAWRWAPSCRRCSATTTRWRLGCWQPGRPRATPCGACPCTSPTGARTGRSPASRPLHVSMPAWARSLQGAYTAQEGAAGWRWELGSVRTQSFEPPRAHTHMDQLRLQMKVLKPWANTSHHTLHAGKCWTPRSLTSTHVARAAMPAPSRLPSSCRRACRLCWGRFATLLPQYPAAACARVGTAAATAAAAGWGAAASTPAVLPRARPSLIRGG